MTTFVDFTPSAFGIPPFQFQPTLDGSVYTATVTASLFGQRWYLSIYTLGGDRVLTTALIGSPNGYDINLVTGIFESSTLVYREASRRFEVTP